MEKPNELPKNVLRYIKFLENKHDEIEDIYISEITRLRKLRDFANNNFKNVVEMTLGLISIDDITESGLKKIEVSLPDKSNMRGDEAVVLIFERLKGCKEAYEKLEQRLRDEK